MTSHFIRREGRKKRRFDKQFNQFCNFLVESPLLPSLPPKENLVIPNSSTAHESSIKFKNFLKVDE